MTAYPFASSVLKVDRLQFAQNGFWEQAQTVYPNSFKDLYNLSNWLEQAPRDIAVETFVTLLISCPKRKHNLSEK